MIKLISLFAVISFQMNVGYAAGGVWVKNNPTIMFNGTPHQVIHKDQTNPEVYYNDCGGYCRAIGYINVNHCGNYNYRTGPYVELDNKGKVIRSYPVEGNENRFLVLAGGSYCSYRAK